MLAIRLRQPKHLTPPKSQQRRCLGGPDPAIRPIAQHAHPVDHRPTHRNLRPRPNAPQLKLRRVTSLSGPTVTSLSGVYNRRCVRAVLWDMDRAMGMDMDRAMVMDMDRAMAITATITPPPTITEPAPTPIPAGLIIAGTATGGITGNRNRW